MIHVSIFFANRKDSESFWLQAAGTAVIEYVRSQAWAKGSLIKGKLTFGTADYVTRFNGDWDAWASTVSTAIDTMTGQRLYNMIVVPEYAGGFVGKATAGIIESALHNNVRCYLASFDANTGPDVNVTTLSRITSIECEDGNDWQTGWKLTVR